MTPLSRLETALRAVREAWRAVPLVHLRRNPFTRKPLRSGRRLRYALVGCGDIGAVHAEALQRAENTELTVVCDREPNLARELGRRHGVPALREYAEVLRREDVDAVVLAVPHHLHAPMAVAALQANRHAVVEKPMARTTAECREMISAEKRSDKRLALCFLERYRLRSCRAKELLEAGVLGRLYSVRIQIRLRREREYWTGGFSGRSISDWRGRKDSAGGGVLIMNAVHALDSLLWLLGSEPDHVQTLMRVQDSRWKDVEDHALMQFSLPGGVLGSVCATTNWPLKDREVLEIAGENGVLRIGKRLSVQLRSSRPGLGAGRRHIFIEVPPVCARTLFYRELSEALGTGRPPETGSRDGLRVQEIIERAYHGAK